MRTLEELKVKNFKSICEQTLQLGRLNVFIGGNGSGKSNLIGVFHFLNRAAAGDLQNYTGEGGSESYFNASVLSDGTLRFICLATLLLQPALPTVILLDEPELGRHPAAISLLAALLESTAQRTQILVATQSVTLINQFTPEFVWVVERENRASVFKHLESADMSA